ncbi:MAG: ribonuclease H-like domain-containing protein [archaeon]
MANYYFDIETTGLNPKTCKIITIQFQKLNEFGDGVKGELVILKAWESSEREILEKFIRMSGILESRWNFIPHGYNLRFEHNFLKEKTKLYGLPIIDILEGPFVDLHSVGIMMNGGKFKGSGLDNITGKVGDGLDVLEMWTFDAYDKIEEYIRREAKEYTKLYVWLKKRMPELLREFRRE